MNFWLYFIEKINVSIVSLPHSIFYSSLIFFVFTLLPIGQYFAIFKKLLEDIRK